MGFKSEQTHKKKIQILTFLDFKITQNDRIPCFSDNVSIPPCFMDVGSYCQQTKNQIAVSSLQSTVGESRCQLINWEPPTKIESHTDFVTDYITKTQHHQFMSTIEFNCHFDNLQHKLLPFAYRLTNNYEDARDLIQETAMRAFNNKEKFEMGTNFRAWVTTIMRNTFINIYRKKKNRATSSEPSDSYVFINENHAVDNAAHSNMTMTELQSIMSGLDLIYRKPFLLFFEGFKYDEIAEQMDLPIGTVKSRIFFARKRLMEMIQFQYAYDTTSVN